MKEIAIMEKDKTITLETMNQWVLPYFYKVAREDHKNQFGIDSPD